MTAPEVFRYALLLGATADFLEKVTLVVTSIAVLVYVIGRVFRRAA